MYFSKLPSKRKHGKTPVPTQGSYNKRSHCSPQTNQMHKSLLLPSCAWTAQLRTMAPELTLTHLCAPLRTLLMPEIHAFWISDLLLFYRQQAWHHHKKKSQVLLYFLHTKSPRFPLEIAVWCAPALKTVLVTALKYGSPQVIRKATHGNS